MLPYWTLIATLAVWRLTHFLVAEDGPWDLVVRLRRRAGAGFWARLLDCFYCLSLWVAAPLAAALGDGPVERLLLWPALSGGAILLERSTAGRSLSMPLAPYHEPQYDEAAREDDRDLLRQPEEAARPRIHAGDANR